LLDSLLQEIFAINARLPGLPVLGKKYMRGGREKVKSVHSSKSLDLQKTFISTKAAAWRTKA